MSEHGFHVHGPHDHELDHAAHGVHGSFGGQLAVITAILATVGAIFSYMSGVTEVEAMRLENDAAVRRTEADNRWAVVLMTAGQLHLAELAAELVPEARKAHFQDEAKRLAVERDAGREAAERLDAESIALDARADEQLHHHHRWSQATTVLQIAIAMAAIALLTKRRWLVWGVFGLGSLGAALGALAWLQI
jgi:hypothetical protein